MTDDPPHRKRIGFLSFGHWSGAPGSQTQSGGEALRQAVELAVAAEEIGIDGAFFRVHHYQRQHAAPFPLLAAIGTATSRIEIGTGVIDMRYENPLYMAEDAGAADLLAGERLQLGISRGSPEPALRGYEAFGYVPAEGETDADMARRHTELFRAAIAGAPVVATDPKMGGNGGRLPIQPRSETLPERIWWGAGTRETGVWTARQGMNLMSSTLLSEDTGVPFDQLQAEQIRMYLEAWEEAGWERRPRVSVSRSVMPIVSDLDHAFFGREVGGSDTTGYLDGGIARFGKTYAGEPDRIAAELAEDAAVALADTLLVTVPNQLGVEYNADLLRNIAQHVAPAIGWSPEASGTTPASQK
jgi:alkanesulfonate monooxygenase SsuD/methylene tetrahydromethanopterin reductase-like flavin-dependent oxidoreductase (luciferase family)